MNSQSWVENGDDELSREAFAELVIRELKKQGVTDRPNERGLPLLSQTAWTAERTYRALLFDQPRAPGSGVVALAVALERKASSEESKDDFSPADDWLRVNRAFTMGVCSLLSATPSVETSRLASALFVDCVFASFYANDSSRAEWLEMDGFGIASELAGNYLKDHRPQDLKTWVNRVAEIATRFRKIGEHEKYRKYLHALRECVAVEAESCSCSSVALSRFEVALDALARCAPDEGLEDATIIGDYWDTFAGAFRDCRKYSVAGTKIAEKALTLLPFIKVALVSNDLRELRPALVASGLSVVDVMLASRSTQETALRSILAAGIVRFSSVAWGDRVFSPQDAFLGSFLLRIAWRSDKACEFMMAIDSVRSRALSSDSTSGYERILWPIVFTVGSSCSDTQEYRATASSIALQRLQSMDAKAAGPLFRYLAMYPVLVDKLRRWEHVKDVISILEKQKPVRPTQGESTSKDSADEDFAKAHATHKRVLGMLRGDGGSID